MPLSFLGIGLEGGVAPIRAPELDDGALRVELRPSGRGRGPSAVVPNDQREALEPMLRASRQEFGQNHVWVTCTVQASGSTLSLHPESAASWRLASGATRR